MSDTISVINNNELTIITMFSHKDNEYLKYMRNKYDFESLKQSQVILTQITKVETKLSPEESIKQNKYQDDRLWKPELIKLVMVMLLLDFYLPLTRRNAVPKSGPHAFQDKGGWYIENSLTTLNQKDPSE